jgi:hypothetical protein
MNAAIAGLIGVALGAGITLLRDRLESGRQQRAWLQDQRLAAYRLLLANALSHGPICSRLHHHRGEPGADSDYEATVLSMYASHADLAILGPPDVHRKGYDLIDAAFALGTVRLRNIDATKADARVQTAEGEFIVAAQKALDIEVATDVVTLPGAEVLGNP